MTSRVRRFAVALTALLLAASATAQDPAVPPESAAPLEGWAYELANELMSPFCPGRTLADCPSPQAKSLQLWIQVQEAAGRTRVDVKDELVERYGDIVLAAPRAEGFGVTAYAIPIAVFFGGGGLVVWLLRRLTRDPSGGEAAQPGAPIDPELERAVDEELARGGR